MLGIAPRDEEGEQIVGPVAVRRTPPQHGPGWLDSLTLGYRAWVVALVLGLGHGLIDVIARERPAHQRAEGEAVEPERTRSGGCGLPRVGRDDLQVRPGAEREQRIVRAEPGVASADLGPDAEAVFQVGDRHGEIRGGIDEMVNQHVAIVAGRDGVLLSSPLPRSMSGKILKREPRTELKTSGS